MSSAFSISSDLLLAAKSGNPDAQNQIILALTPLLQKLAARYFLIGSDKEDLLQEARIGLHQAIQACDPERAESFIPFATVCIRNHIISAINEAQAQKHAALNKSVTLEDAPLFSYDNPLDYIINREKLESILQSMQEKLSQKERQVLFLYLDGMSYKKIAETLQINTKAVSNALCRIRSKLS